MPRELLSPTPTEPIIFFPDVSYKAIRLWLLYESAHVFDYDTYEFNLIVETIAFVRKYDIAKARVVFSRC